MYVPALNAILKFCRDVEPRKAWSHQLALNAAPVVTAHPPIEGAVRVLAWLQYKHNPYRRGERANLPSPGLPPPDWRQAAAVAWDVAESRGEVNPDDLDRRPIGWLRAGLAEEGAGDRRWVFLIERCQEAAERAPDPAPFARVLIALCTGNVVEEPPPKKPKKKRKPKIPEGEAPPDPTDSF